MGREAAVIGPACTRGRVDCAHAKTTLAPVSQRIVDDRQLVQDGGCRCVFPGVGTYVASVCRDASASYPALMNPSDRPLSSRAIPANVVTFATFEAVVHAFGHLT